jgi:hypothetical protein
MRSLAARAFAIVAVIGIAIVVIVAATDDRSVAFTLGVNPGLVAAEVAPGRVVCQTPVSVADTFGAVQFQVGTYHRSGPELEVFVRRQGSPRPTAAGRLAAGYPDVSKPIVAIDPAVSKGTRAEICFRNLGDRRVALYGGPEMAKRGSTARLGSRDLRTDLTLTFMGDQSTAIATTPEVFERASLFRPVWIGPWAYWLLAGLLLIAVPALLIAALRAVHPGP